MAKILVTGATGFVGKRLIMSLLEKGHEIFALCRILGTNVFAENKPNFHSIWGDLKNPETLKNLPKDIEVAYYLVHSMSEIVGDLIQEEMEVADNFVQGIKETKVKQIIYLGGIINDESKMSPHLRSRLLVENELKKSGIAVTILRASIIIGAGSASFEIIRDLCEKLPVMIAPRWLETRCQPIAIQDVLFYLSNVLLNEDCYSKTFDIGGPEVLTFKQLLLEYADYRGLKRHIFDVPFVTPRISSFWLVFITSVRFSLCLYLVESIKTSSVVKLKELENILPHKTLTFRKALELAFQNISQNEVVSTWMDAWEIAGSNPDISTYIEVPKEGCLKDERRFAIKGDPKAAIDRIWSIGGKNGYYALNWSWKLRGLIDQFVGGVGLNRGRRNPTELLVGDYIDFWRVIVADKNLGHLILFASMKLPGEAWLEFKVNKEKNGNGFELIQSATYRPRGLWGRLYWYAMLPFHIFIFRKMAKSLAQGKN